MSVVHLSRAPSSAFASMVSSGNSKKYVYAVNKQVKQLYEGRVTPYTQLGAFRRLATTSAGDTLIKVQQAFQVFPPIPKIAIDVRQLKNAQLVPILPSDEAFEFPGNPRSMMLVLSADYYGDYADFIVTSMVSRSNVYVNYNHLAAAGGGLRHSSDQIGSKKNVHQILVNGSQVSKAVLAVNAFQRKKPLVEFPDVFLTIVDPNDLSTVYVIVSRPHSDDSYQAVVGVLSCTTDFCWTFRHVDDVQCKLGTILSTPSAKISQFVSTL